MFESLHSLNDEPLYSVVQLTIQLRNFVCYINNININDSIIAENNRNYPKNGITVSMQLISDKMNNFVTHRAANSAKIQKKVAK